MNPAPTSPDRQAPGRGTLRAASEFPWPEAIVLVVAFVTRFWRLDYHSFWFDEVVSLNWAGSDASYIWNTTFPLVQDKHPPAYYLLLHYWRTLLDFFGAGESDAALRASGALLGTLTVLGVLLLARRLSGRATGLLAGLLVALSPVLVWYSQELRMFQPATTGLVWAGYCLLRGWQAPRWRTALLWWGGFVVALEFALYSYLFSAFMLPAAGLALIALWAVDRAAHRTDPAAEKPSFARSWPGWPRSPWQPCSSCRWHATPGWSTTARGSQGKCLWISWKICSDNCRLRPCGASNGPRRCTTRR